MRGESGRQTTMMLGLTPDGLHGWLKSVRPYNRVGARDSAREWAAETHSSYQYLFPPERL